VLSRFSIEHYSRISTREIQDKPDLHSFVSILRVGRLPQHPHKRIGRPVRTCEPGSQGPERGWVFEPGRGPRRRNLSLDGQGRGRVCDEPIVGWPARLEDTHLG
jgi:hypothetical protein